VCTLYNNIVLFVYGVLCLYYPLESHIIIDITSRRFEWAKRCVYSSCTSSICTRFSLLAALPHTILSYTYLTSRADRIFHNVFQSILVYAFVVYLGHTRQCRRVRRIMRCYSCVCYVVCVYYFLLLVHFLCRLSPLG